MFLDGIPEAMLIMCPGLTADRAKAVRGQYRSTETAGSRARAPGSVEALTAEFASVQADRYTLLDQVQG